MPYLQTSWHSYYQCEKKDTECYWCGKTGHLSRHCRVRQNTVCEKCEIKGRHKTEDCNAKQCVWCKKFGHSKFHCPSWRNLTCQKCMSFGHRTQKCRARVPLCYICAEKGEPGDHMFLECRIARGKVEERYTDEHGYPDWRDFGCSSKSFFSYCWKKYQHLFFEQGTRYNTKRWLARHRSF